ncbi:hypothetical protein ADJ73_05025 [Arsenicicoccus sp. oral taxon 190]|nr:hypothetical protein ADJ73_05025 [Arsenicicoccus sp. oral taxon 190]
MTLIAFAEVLRTWRYSPLTFFLSSLTLVPPASAWNLASCSGGGDGAAAGAAGAAEAAKAGTAQTARAAASTAEAEAETEAADMRGGPFGWSVLSGGHDGFILRDGSTLVRARCLDDLKDGPE